MDSFFWLNKDCRHKNQSNLVLVSYMTLSSASLAFCLLVPHQNLKCHHPAHHLMLQCCQFGLDGHQARVLAFNPNLFLDVDFFTPPGKNIAYLVMSPLSGSKDPVS